MWSAILIYTSASAASDRLVIGRLFRDVRPAGRVGVGVGAVWAVRWCWGAAVGDADGGSGGGRRGPRRGSTREPMAAMPTSTNSTAGQQGQQSLSAHTVQPQVHRCVAAAAQVRTGEPHTTGGHRRP
jgi:hypothetical protein